MQKTYWLCSIPKLGTHLGLKLVAGPFVSAFEVALASAQLGSDVHHMMATIDYVPEREYRDRVNKALQPDHIAKDVIC